MHKEMFHFVYTFAKSDGGNGSGFSDGFSASVPINANSGKTTMWSNWSLHDKAVERNWFGNTVHQQHLRTIALVLKDNE
jgi:hypothetical protein